MPGVAGRLVALACFCGSMRHGVASVPAGRPSLNPCRVAVQGSRVNVPTLELADGP